jgi:pimeloyl-ACP methyl ester carboxylesterase
VADNVDVQPFTLKVPDADIADLHDRLSRTRWADASVASDWSRGVPLSYLKELSEYWRVQFQWRDQEAKLNAFPQFVTTIDGQRVHFLHVRSQRADATPLLMVHGYPGSIVEFLDVIEPLTDPERFGGDPEEAFHVVVPSVPGFGCSTPLAGPGWEISRSASVFAELMRKLGYDKYGLHGGDIGAGIVGRLAAVNPDNIIGVHMVSDPGAVAATTEHMPLPAELSEATRSRIAELRAEWDTQKGYLVLQSHRPQTLAHALIDSPIAQLAWIVDSFKEWTSPDFDLPEEAVGIDQLLTNVSLYWFTRSGASAAQFLYEAAHSDMEWVAAPATPQGWAIFNSDDVVRRVIDPYGKIEHWSEFSQGGHFPAMEVPELLIEDVRAFFQGLR